MGYRLGQVQPLSLQSPSTKWVVYEGEYQGWQQEENGVFIYKPLDMAWLKQQARCLHWLVVV